MKKYYVTTPIYYVNDKPHIGHTYTTIAADVLARYKRLQGYEVFFLTGTDEHGEKVEQAAKKAGKPTQEFVDENAKKFSDCWKQMNVSYDYFVRTTDKEHERVVAEIYQKLYDQGDIYLGKYTGLYCVSCESYVTGSQAVEGKCPDCGKELVEKDEESYFFKLSKYQDRLLKYIQENKGFILPVSRKNEVVGFIKQGLKDISVSRTTFEWGVKLPFDEKHISYVWIDALSNYITAIGYRSKEIKKRRQFEKLWPAEVHLLGKDILKFHAIYWPAILMALNLELPERIFAHGWWTIEGEKMSKSKGNFLDPLDVKKKYPVDAFRYFLFRELPFGLDGDYSEKALVQRINSELGNDLGNLLNRVVVMSGKYCGGKIYPVEGLEKEGLETLKRFDELTDKQEFHNALARLFDFIGKTNKYLNDQAPWKKASEGKQEEVKKALGSSANALAFIAFLLHAFMPDTSEKILFQLGVKTDFTPEDYKKAIRFGLIKKGSSVGKPEILFPRITG